MTLLEAIVEEASNLFQQIKRHTLYLFNKKQKEEQNRFSGARGSASKHPTSPIVLLIQGYFIRDIHLKGLQDFLTSQGFNTICEPYSYQQDLNTIESQIVSSKIKKLHQKTGKTINLIGYSAGGLIARSIAQKYPELIDKVITLGAPHQGTLAALFASFIPSAKQMLPGSDYIKELNQKPIPENVDFYSIYSLHDQAVIPNKNAAIPSTYKNVKNLPRENTGHWGLIGEEIYPLIADILKK